MHFRAAHRARSSGQRAVVPHRHAANLPAARLFRDLHVPAGAEGFLFQRLASASIAGRCGDRRQSVHAAEAPAKFFRRSASLISRALLQYAVPGTVFATPTVNGYRRFRPNSLAPDRATWAYDHRGAMIRVLGGVGRSGDAAGEPRRRAGGQSLSLHPVADRHRARRHRDQTRHCRRQATNLTPPNGRCCRRACPRRSMRSRRSRCSAARSAIPLSTISSS